MIHEAVELVTDLIIFIGIDENWLHGSIPSIFIKTFKQKDTQIGVLTEITIPIFLWNAVLEG